MTQLGRRGFLRLAGLTGATLGGGASLVACNTAPQGAGGAEGSAAGLEWWDHFNPLQDLHQEIFEQFTKRTGVPVRYTPVQTAKLGQQLQLAKQSHQLPDIHSNVGLELPLPALIRDNWYQPIELGPDLLKRLPEDAVVEGITMFDGKVYSFPLFSVRQYWAANWFNRDLVKQAGLDPNEPPETYDEFRKAARAVKRLGDNTYGWMLALGQPSRLAEQIGFLAQACGFEGQGGVLFGSGEYAYHHDSYVNVIEFWLSLREDGVLVPGTESFDDKVARTRWATGIAGYYFDGPWCAGVVAQDLSEFTDKMDVGPMLVPEKGMPVTAYRGPVGGAFWLSGESEQQQEASRLLGRLTTPEYYVGLAENMDQPPLDLSAVERADVLPVYKKLVGWFQDAAFLAPTAIVKNPDLAKVNAEMKPIEPDLDTTVQGLFSGDLTNVRKQLKALSDRSEQERERALAEAKKNGAEAELSDWAFPDWQPRKDYTLSMY